MSGNARLTRSWPSVARLGNRFRHERVAAHLECFHDKSIDNSERLSVTAKTKNIRLFVLLLTIWFSAGCERPTHVRIEGGTTPVFAFSGSGNLASFVVYSPDFAAKAESPWDENFALWKIKPIGDHSNATPVGKLEGITYGVVPGGYKQVKPEVGSAPPLTAGHQYFYDVETTNAQGTAGYLEIRNSQAVPTDGPHACFGREGQKWKRVACPQ
jgi:hypothetical protein